LSLIDYNLMGEKVDKVQTAINRLQAFEPEEGYYLAFSGGKDSVCIKALADLAGVKYDAHYNATTVDPPELVRFIREHHTDVEIVKPDIPMRKLIVQKRIPPTRLVRYCCAHYKEKHGEDRVTLTGTRWAESSNRRNNQGVVTIFNGKAGAVAEENGANFTPTNRGGWYSITTIRQAVAR
jgi:phosphoadenosine phosphosulfate reductase